MASGLNPQSVREKEDVKEISIQFPEINELVIGNVSQVEVKKPIHPISIDFNDNDALWITQTFKPKS